MNVRPKFRRMTLREPWSTVTWSLLKATSLRHSLREPRTLVDIQLQLYLLYPTPPGTRSDFTMYWILLFVFSCLLTKDKGSCTSCPCLFYVVSHKFNSLYTTCTYIYFGTYRFPRLLRCIKKYLGKYRASWQQLHFQRVYVLGNGLILSLTAHYGAEMRIHTSFPRIPYSAIVQGVCYWAQLED